MRLTNQAIRHKAPLTAERDGHPMATDRRRFLSLMALGVPATAHAMRQDPAPASPAKALIEEDGIYESAFLMDLVPSVRQHLWDAFLRCNVSMRVVRNA